MTTITSVHQAVDTAIHAATAESTKRKTEFLAVLRSQLQIAPETETKNIGTQSDFLADILARFAEYPIEHSRLREDDLSRRLDCISWSSLGNAMAAIRELVLDCVSVPAGDCNECGGEEMTFMLDCSSDSIVRHCELCGNSHALTEGSTNAVHNLKLPTIDRLAREGVVV